MALAVRVGVTLPAVSGWERNLYRPRRPTAQRLDDELVADGALLAVFGYLPLPRPDSELTGSLESESRVSFIERRIAELSDQLAEVQNALGHDGGPDRRASLG
ncbi:hypothetical protein BH10ACT2_BH10ACT2_21110 [soil metagenome]